MMMVVVLVVVRCGWFDLGGREVVRRLFGVLGRVRGEWRLLRLVEGLLWIVRKWR